MIAADFRPPRAPSVALTRGLGTYVNPPEDRRALG